MPHTEIRPARAEDRDAVLAFCVKTWEWGDYVEYVWDEWLNDPNGALLVAIIDDRPVGVVHLQMLTPDDAWLEGLRVDPDYRHQGLGSALNIACMEEAMRRGARYARLLTASDNVASIAMVERNLWRRVGSFVALSAQPMTTLSEHEVGPDLPRLAMAADSADIRDYLNASNIMPLSGGLYYQFFTAYVINDDLIRAKIDAGDVYVLRRWQRLDGLAFAETLQGRQDSSLFIGYVDGTSEAISLIAYALRKQAADMGLPAIRAHVPDMMMVRDAFVAAGYEWNGDTFYTYEHKLF